jgi:uncharacterized membrane protein YcaP (DUF421 family)
VLGNAVQNAMINNDNTLVGGLVAATVLLVLNRLFNMLTLRSHRIEALMVGEPVLIISNGMLLAAPMKRQGITEEQVLAALREHGMDDVAAVHMAVLEVDGTISVVPSGSNVLKTKRHFRALRLP